MKITDHLDVMIELIRAAQAANNLRPSDHIVRDAIYPITREVEVFIDSMYEVICRDEAPNAHLYAYILHNGGLDMGLAYSRHDARVAVRDNAFGPHTFNL